jgi:hypothetical protein
MKCVKCSEPVKAGKWDCWPGEKHEVEQRIYHIASTCTDVADRMKSHLRVYVTSDREVKDENGTTNMIPARFVEIIGGTYATTDPEDIFFFETKYQKHIISKEEWQKLYIHPKEQQAMKERELEARSQRLESQENALLTRIQKLKDEEANLAKGSRAKVGA